MTTNTTPESKTDLQKEILAMRRKLRRVEKAGPGAFMLAAMTAKRLRELEYKQNQLDRANSADLLTKLN